MTEARNTSPEPVAAWATDCRDKYPENHDSGYAGRVCLADGNLVWAAVIADGCGGSMEGLKVSALAIQAFVDAVRKSTLAELSDAASRETWCRAWTKALHADAFARFKGGMSTFCGAVLLPPSGEGGSWTLFALNVGDSQVWRLTGDGKCMGITPDAPPNNANVEGHNPIRVVGVAPKADFALIDIEEFPLPANGPVWVLAGSDGFFSKKKGKDEICIFSSGDLRDVCMTGAPFHELPALAIKRSLANAQKLGCAEMMDNATVAMLGFRVPPTNLSAASGGALPAAPASAAQTAPAPAGRPDAASGGRRAAPAAQTRPKAADAAPGGGRRAPAAPTATSGGGRMLLAVAATAIVALLLGFLLGGAGRKTGQDGPAQPVLVASPAANVDLRGVPKEGRCQYCLELEKQGKLKMADTFHWAKDCKRNPALAGSRTEPAAKP